MNRVRIAVLGAGSIGRRHIEIVASHAESMLAAIIDPAPAAQALASEMRVPWAPSLSELVRTAKPEGLIVATPNQMHAEQGIEAIEAGIPVLVEKPIADDVGNATRLVEASERTQVPLLVGHHRRHNPMIQKAKSIVDSGRLGRVLSVHGTCWFLKPDEYFEPAWRREKGAGPIFLNLIHDVDNFRYLCGNVASVQAFESNAVRQNPVEETSVIALRFATGALGTINVSDAIVAPWSWELTSGENRSYPHTGEACYYLGGTRGSLTVPYLDVWNNPGKQGWWQPISAERVAFDAADPLEAQVRNFCGVIRGTEQPVVSGRDGLDTLKVILAVKEAAASGKRIDLA